MQTTTYRDNLGPLLEQSKNIWAAGDFSAMAHSTVLAGELLCEAVELKAGERVLDVATGSGNAALAAARRACEVTGVDFVEPLLDRARERAAVERLRILFQYGEVENIPFEEGVFDVALSTFGTMFTLSPDRAASEMFRVVRRGGRVGMTAWCPDGISGRMFDLERRYTAGAAGEADPVLWGSESEVARRLDPYASSIRLRRRTLRQRSRSFQHWLSVRLKYFGPLKTAHERLSPEDRSLLVEELRCLVEGQSRSGDHTILLENNYLEIVAVKR